MTFDETVRPQPDPALAAAVADAARDAIVQLRARHPEQFSAVALMAGIEGSVPSLMTWSVAADVDAEHERWGAPHAVVELTVEGFPGEAGDPTADRATWLASVEEGLRLLDIEGFFGIDREHVLLLAGTTPSDDVTAGAARRLNPDGPLRDEWLHAVSGQAPLEVDAAASVEHLDLHWPEAPAPNPTIAALWRITPGVLSPDGIVIYGPKVIAERNETFEVSERAPGWVLVGDDSGGAGLLMRASGPGFDPAVGREAAEVFLVELEALGEGDGEFLTDDLIGWLAG